MGSKVSPEIELKTTWIESIATNDIKKVATLMQDDPEYVRKNCKILRHAPTEEMIHTLINYTHKPTQWVQNIDEETERIKEAIRQSNLKYCFGELVDRWPDIAKEYMDSFIVIKGHTTEDINLRVVFVTELLVGTNEKNMYDVRPLVYMAESENFHLLTHPFTRYFCYSEGGTNILLRAIYITLAVVQLIFVTLAGYDEGREFACPSYPGSGLLFLTYLTQILFLTCLAIMALSEIAQMFLYRIRYLFDSMNYLHCAIIVVSPWIIITTDSTYALFAILLLWMNVILCLRNTRFFGKYILMIMEVTKTFLKLAMPFVLLVVALSMGGYTLFYSDAVKTALETKIKGDTELAAACQGNASFDASFTDTHLLNEEFKVDWEFQYFVKTNLRRINDALGNNNPATATSTGNLKLGTLRLSFSLYWLFVLAALTIVFMNLLIGLTVGDVGKIVELANAKIVALEIMQMWDSEVRVKILRYIPIMPCQSYKKAKTQIWIDPNYNDRTKVDWLRSTLDDLMVDYVLGRGQVSDAAKQHAVNYLANSSAK